MASRASKTQKKKGSGAGKKTAVKKTESKSAKTTTSKEKVVAKFGLSKKHKLMIIGVVLLAAFVLITGKQFFVAATVNGQPISRLEVIRELEKQSGQQVLDSLIAEKLVLQEARKANIVATDEEVDSEIDSIREQMAAQGQDLDAVLEAEGLSTEELRRQIKVYQIYPKKLLADKVSVTDEEVQNFVNTYLATDDSMTDEEKMDFAREQVVQQKISTELSVWLADIKSNADINYFVEY